MGQPISAHELLDFGAPGSDYGPRTNVVLGADVNFTIPVRGWVLVEVATHAIVETTYDSGSTYITVCPASSVLLVWSDGFSTRFNADGTGETAHYTQLVGAF